MTTKPVTGWLVIMPSGKPQPIIWSTRKRAIVAMDSEEGCRVEKRTLSLVNPSQNFAWERPAHKKRQRRREKDRP